MNHYRTLSFIKKYYNGEIPKFEVISEDEQNLMIAQVAKELKDYIDKMECIKYAYYYYYVIAKLYWLMMFRLREGLKVILSISRLGNGFIQAHEPWKLIKGTTADQ